MSTFAGAEEAWSARLGNLRNVVRQHVVTEQLARHLDGVGSVLDVGCGQGTQALRLAALGLRVTGVDPAEDLLERCRRDARAASLAVETISGDLASLDRLLAGRTFDLVCAHGLLMYLPDAEAAIECLLSRAGAGGLLSFTVRNGDALAYRPGLRGDFTAALAAFDAVGYRNDLGVSARAHTLDQALGWCRGQALHVEAWYGVRVLTDPLPADTLCESVDLPACLAAEVEAGRRDPYRRLASMLHVVARRPA